MGKQYPGLTKDQSDRIRVLMNKQNSPHKNGYLTENETKELSKLNIKRCRANDAKSKARNNSSSRPDLSLVQQPDLSLVQQGVFGDKPYQTNVVKDIRLKKPTRRKF
ncbi:hypothetical protein [Aquimarina sp. RZ0]|uniref:hypothetical protein n=1 Tax=Aquimarina sp. RZ0 TaxID=2607730 RepID=UPI0011F21029|nr:hypothetical protein [Aquimarina sp. RZ0]KAA1240349.1 hypothetical protein F0000_27065 [Aquimarina sp. RZ0]